MKRLPGMATALLAVATLVTWGGCAADPEETSVPAPDAAVEQDTGVDAAKDGPRDAAKDAGKDSPVFVFDAEPEDAGLVFDAGPPAPPAGGACTTPGELVTTYCGFCGSRQSVCEATKVWSAPGPCNGAIVGGCTPFTTRSSPCGNCGTGDDLCSASCGWKAGACVEPPGACTAGAVDFTSAGCTTAGEYKVRTCDTMCTYGAFSATCAPRKLAVPSTVGGAIRTELTFEPARTMRRLYEFATCPNATFSSITAAYDSIIVENTTAKTARVTAYNTRAIGGTELDTILWTYSGTTPPTTDPQLLACVSGVGNLCTGTLASNPCGNKFSNYNLAALENILIGPGQKILVYVAGYDATQLGRVTLVIRTDALL